MIVQVMGYRPIIVETIAAYTGADTAQVATVDTVADVAGNLNGTYFTMWAGANTQKYVFWFDLSKSEVTDFTMRADVAGDLFGKYFLFSSTNKDYYAYFTNAATAQVTDVTMRADVSSDLDGTYWLLN